MAVAKANWNVNRLGEDMVALQQRKPQVAIFWSMATNVWADSPNATMDALYRQLLCLDQPVGFFTERMLGKIAATGALPPHLADTKLLFIPKATHVPTEARKGLEVMQSLGVALVPVNGPIDHDDYDNPLSASLQYEPISLETKGNRFQPVLLDSLRRHGLEPVALALDSEGKPLYGCEVRSALSGENRLVTLCNYTCKPMDAVLSVNGRPSVVFDCLKREKQENPLTLRPLEPLVLRVLPSRKD
jgi:hypothetical protein